MFDWLTLKRDVSSHEYELISDYLAEKPHLMKITPATGEVEWSQPIRESIRSDSHQVQVYVTHNTITISGSPARSSGQSTNVFGSDNLLSCATSHIAAAQNALPFDLGEVSEFRITRIDVTHNYDLGGSSEVRQALAYLRQFDGGRYRVNTESETVYWSKGSALRSGKAYHKGAHLRYTNKRGLTDVNSETITLADRLLRLELKLGNKWFSRMRENGVNVWDIDYQREFQEYFSTVINSQVEVKEVNLLEKIEAVAPSDGQALAAYRTWALIKSIGHQSARESMPKATWYRHTRMLKDAGLGWGDFASGQVIPFRTRVLDLNKHVDSWEELRKAASN